MECRFEIKSFDDGWAVVNMIGEDANETHTFSLFCKSLEEAEEYIRTHDAEKEVKKRLKNLELAIKEEDEMDDGKLHATGFGFEERAGNMIEYEEF